MSAYFLYSVAIRPQVKEQNPDASFGDIAKIISQQFKALSPKERAMWDTKAVSDKERYTRGKRRFHLNFMLSRIAAKCRISHVTLLFVVSVWQTWMHTTPRLARKVVACLSKGS